MGLDAQSIKDDLFKQSSTQAGMQSKTPSFEPEMRVRIKDLFSKNVNAVLGSGGSQLQIPAMVLDKSRKQAGDNGLMSVNIQREMGVVAGNSATMVFANFTGKLYRSDLKQAKKGPAQLNRANTGAVQLAPTVEEETLNVIPSPQAPTPAADGILTPKVAIYLKGVIANGLMGADLATERQQLITDLRAELRNEPAASVDITDFKQSTRDKLIRLMRNELMFDKMAPIEIDMKDAKGRWFGVFTGFISEVEDTMAPGEIPAVSVTCLDKMALFARTLAVIQQVLAPAAILSTNAEGLTFDRKALIANDRLDSKLIWQVFELLVKVANATFTAQGYYSAVGDAGQAGPEVALLDEFTDEEYGLMFPSHIRAGLNPELVGPAARVTPLLQQGKQDNTRFWDFNKQLLALGPLQTKGRNRHVRLFRLWTLPNLTFDKQPTRIQSAGSGNKVAAAPQFLNWGDYRGLNPYWPFQTMEGGIWGSRFERYLHGASGIEIFPGALNEGAKGDFSVPFRESGLAMFDQAFRPLAGGTSFPAPIAKFATLVLRTMWTQFMNSTAPAIDKLANMEQATFTNIYTTGLGDLVFALPRWNQVPLPDVDSIEAGPDTTLDNVSDTEAEDLGLDRHDYFHGREYIMSDFGIVSRKIASTEDGKFDKVLAQGIHDLLGTVVPPNLAPLLTLGGSLGTNEFQAMFGDRTMTVQQAFPVTNVDDVKVLAHYAAAVKTMLSMRSNTLDIVYRLPRPVELGRTVFLPDNCYLYYVTGINRSWRIGEEYTESYHAEYGHPVWYHLPIPWVTRANDFQQSVQDLKNTAAAPPASPIQQPSPSGPTEPAFVQQAITGDPLLVQGS